MVKYVTKKFRGGVIKEVAVDLQYSPELLQTILDNFGFNEFTVSDVEVFYPNILRTTLIARLDSLWRNRWLKKTSCSNRLIKDCRRYQLNENRVNSYLEEHDSLDDENGWLVKNIRPKKPKTIREIKEIKKEIKEIDKTEYLGKWKE